MAGHVSTIPRLEQYLTRGHAVWLLAANFNNVERTATFRFTAEPERQNPDRVLTFFDVPEYRDDQHPGDADSQAIDSLLGIKVDGRIAGTRYTITTEASEIALFTLSKPRIEFSGRDAE